MLEEIQSGTFLIIFASTIAGLAWWLASRFNAMEHSCHNEIRQLRREMTTVGLRLQKLELREFGFTQTVNNEHPISPTSENGGK